MQAMTRTARHGGLWILDGFRIYRKNPLALSALVLGYWMAMALVGAIPLVGQIAATVMIPVFSVSLMNACRDLDLGRRLKPDVLFSGFRRHANSLLLLGVVYLAVSLTFLGLTTLIDDGVLFRFVVDGVRPDKAAIESGELMIAGQVLLALSTPLILAFWYAPPLVAWHDLPPAKSLFFSMVAGLRNWRAFLVYGFCVFIFGALIPGMIVGITVAALQGAADFLSFVFMFLLVFVLLPTLYASFYASYRDVFVTLDDNA